MRSHLGGGLVLVVVAAAVALAVYGRAAEREALRQMEARAERGASGELAPEEPSPANDESKTRPVADIATDADGLLELRVTEAGRPVPRAQVRLYRRGGRVPSTGLVDWRLAATGATGDDGRLQMPARAGAYLVSARTEGLAPAWRELVHPLDGNLTPVHLRLVAGGAFTGRTVRQDTGQSLPRVELTLTPHVSVWEPEARADVPAEEQVTGTSDGSGRFLFEGLAPGLYTLEARAPGAMRAAEWSIRIPADEPRVLALPGAEEGAGSRPPRRPPSKELRCGT